MKYREKTSMGVGRMLIFSIGIVFILTVLSVLVSTMAIDNIDVSGKKLTNESIPALVDAGHMSGIAINIIRQSQTMVSSVSKKELDEKMKQTSLSTKSLLDNLNKLERYNLANKLIVEIQHILDYLNGNIVEVYELKSRKLDYDKKLSKEINLILMAIETIEDKVSLMKINEDYSLLQKINTIESNNLNLTRESIRNEVNNIELLSSIIKRSGEIRKDINVVYNTIDDDSILLYQQDFDHSLRKIVRAIVQSSDINFDKSIKENISILIEFGQDSPDVFDVKKDIISVSKRLEMIAQENIIHTQNLNEAVSLLVNQVREDAEIVSEDLDRTIVISRNSLYVILFVALFISALISWKYIYKRIIVRLAELSLTTKKLSNNNFQFKINTQGDDEFSDLAIALESLREHSLKRISMNNELKKNSLKLKQSNEDLSQFAYIASHDLQEPLRMIGSYVQLIKSRHKGKLDKDSDKYIDFAVDGCVRMKALIEGLLEYSRVESSEEEPQLIECNVLLDDVIHDLSVIILEKNAEIVIGDLSDIYAVPSQLRRVFANLISNALKYCECEIPRVEIQSAIVNDEIKFSIKDNGIGIKDQYQEKIFVIFKRLHSRAEYSGTGIGLSICKKIIEGHNGHITLESEFGNGTTFYFTLPLVPSIKKVDEYKIAV